jgi:hypothetical protein
MLLVGFGGTQVAAEPASMQGYWRFDTGYCNIAYDSSDYNNDGLLSGGKFGRALEFDGMDDYVSVTDSSSLRSPSTEITIECWVKLGSASDQLQYIARKWYSSDGGWGSYALARNSANQILGTIQLKPQYPGWTTTVSVPEGEWHHIAFVWKAQNYDASDGKIFIDGTEVSVTFNPHSYSSGFTIGYDNYPLYIGKKVNTAWADWYDGSLDEIRISNIVRYSADFTPQTIPFSTDTNTVGLWHFDEGSGLTTSDASENSNTGNINGATWIGTPPAWVDGKYGKALQFDGIDDKVVVEHDTSLSLVDAYTIEAWVYRDPSCTSALQYIVSKDVSTGSLPYSNYNLCFWNDRLCLLLKGLTIDSATKGIGYSDSGGGGIKGATLVSKDVWHHVAGVYTGSELKVYLNGDLDGAVSVTGTPQTNTEDVWIGMRKHPNYDPGEFHGIIDEVRIWDRALTPCQVNLAMDGKMEILPQAGLVIYDSSIHDLLDGDTVTICIISDSPMTKAYLNPNRGATPKKTNGWIDSDDALTEPDAYIDSTNGYSVTFDVYQGTRPCKTIHLWLELETGEHIGVNLHFKR